MIAAREETREQIERILDSEVLSSSDGLRRLFRFLAEKSLSGEADQLKEYIIGTDAFGKPADYDPQQDSTVRIQVGRLRQKLAEYYQGEGKYDQIVVELPKGHYKLKVHTRQTMDTDVVLAPELPPPAVPASRFPRIAVLLTVGLVAVAGWALRETWQVRSLKIQTSNSQLTPEQETLWAPFLNSERPVLISINAPLFVSLPGIGFFRDKSVNHDEEVAKSPTIEAVRKALKLPAVEDAGPAFQYTIFGNLNVAYLLGRFLGTRNPQASIVNTRELSWQQLSENNVLFIGYPRYFSQQTRMPIDQLLVMAPDVGVQNLRPAPGEQKIYVDDVAPNASGGVVYALVSLTPGPLENGYVESFGSRYSAGITAAVQWFTASPTAKAIVETLRGKSEKVPRFYQVLLKVRYEGGLPLQTSYVLHRELQSSPGR